MKDLRERHQINKEDESADFLMMRMSQIQEFNTNERKGILEEDKKQEHSSRLSHSSTDTAKLSFSKRSQEDTDPVP